MTGYGRHHKMAAMGSKINKKALEKEEVEYLFTVGKTISE